MNVTPLLLTIFFILFTKQQFVESLDYRRNRYSRSDNDGVSPWAKSGKFQGDIAGYNKKTFDNLVKEMNKWQELRQKHGNNSKFDSATSDPRGLWMNGRVPYVIQSSNTDLRQAVLEAIADYHKFTCIRFIPRTNEPNYVNIIEGDGCYSELGNVRQGAQDLSLGDGCQEKGTAIHELMHAIGFWHEQQRTDRDKFIIVYLDNVQQKFKDQYDKADTSEMNLIGNYDMDSIMHYRYKDFALPGKIVMKAKDSDRTDFGGEELTPEDIRKIRLLYRCDDDKGGRKVEVASIVPGVEYYIKASGTENCWDVPGEGTKDGLQLQQWDCNETPGQQFVFTHLNGDIYTIKNAGTGKFVDVAQQELNKDGGKVQQWTKIDNLKNQQFHILEKEGSFHITSVANGQVITSDTEGQLRHWKVDGGWNWDLELVQQ